MSGHRRWKSAQVIELTAVVTPRRTDRVLFDKKMKCFSYLLLWTEISSLIFLCPSFPISCGFVKLSLEGFYKIMIQSHPHLYFSFNFSLHFSFAPPNKWLLFSSFALLLKFGLDSAYLVFSICIASVFWATSAQLTDARIFPPAGVKGQTVIWNRHGDVTQHSKGVQTPKSFVGFSKTTWALQVHKLCPRFIGRVSLNNDQSCMFIYYLIIYLFHLLCHHTMCPSFFLGSSCSTCTS